MSLAMCSNSVHAPTRCWVEFTLRRSRVRVRNGRDNIDSACVRTAICTHVPTDASTSGTDRPLRNLGELSEQMFYRKQRDGAQLDFVKFTVGVSFKHHHTSWQRTLASRKCIAPAESLQTVKNSNYRKTLTTGEHVQDSEIFSLAL